MQEEESDAAAPQQRGQADLDRPAEREAEAAGGREPAERPRRERPIDEAQHRIGQQVGRIAVARAALVVDEQPAQVGVHEAAQGADADAVIDVRAGIPGASANAWCLR